MKRMMIPVLALSCFLALHGTALADEAQGLNAAQWGRVAGMIAGVVVVVLLVAKKLFR